MKIRNGFVSNSSTSSFIVKGVMNDCFVHYDLTRGDGYILTKNETNLWNKLVEATGEDPGQNVEREVYESELGDLWEDYEFRIELHKGSTLVAKIPVEYISIGNLLDNFSGCEEEILEVIREEWF